MTDKKREKPLGLDMSFDEALRRFAQTDADEVKESIERAKEKKPPGEDTARRPARRRREKAASPARRRKDGDA